MLDGIINFEPFEKAFLHLRRSESSAFMPLKCGSELVAAPSTKLAVYGMCFDASSAFSRELTAGFGSSPNEEA